MSVHPVTCRSELEEADMTGVHPKADALHVGGDGNFSP
jgi:hypothetical protein